MVSASRYRPHVYSAGWRHEPKLIHMATALSAFVLEEILSQPCYLPLSAGGVEGPQRGPTTV
jgi:hypothetical protein